MRRRDIFLGYKPKPEYKAKPELDYISSPNLLKDSTSLDKSTNNITSIDDVNQGFSKRNLAQFFWEKFSGHKLFRECQKCENKVSVMNFTVITLGDENLIVCKNCRKGELVVDHYKGIHHPLKAKSFFKYSGNAYKCLCRFCTKPICFLGMFHAIHIVARAKGGLTSLENMGISCADCNQSMNVMNADEFARITKCCLEENFVPYTSADAELLFAYYSDINRKKELRFELPKSRKRKLMEFDNLNQQVIELKAENKMVSRKVMELEYETNILRKEIRTLKTKLVMMNQLV